MPIRTVHKRILSSRPSSTNEASLYAPSVGEESIINLRACNQSSSTTVKIRVAHTLTDTSIKCARQCIIILLGDQSTGFSVAQRVLPHPIGG